MKQLIVNADDFGRAPGVNRGIIEAHLNGIVTSTTVMINLPDAPAALELAAAEAPRLGVGLHVNLTKGKPVSPPQSVRSLLDESGEFHHISEWARLYDHFDPDHIRREIAAQVARFVQLTGHPPDHLDSHHHAAYLHPVALEAMLEIARGYNIPLRQVRADDDPERAARDLVRILPAFPLDMARRVVEAVGDVLARQDKPPFWPARLELGFYGETATLGDLLVILTNLPPDSLTELMCHPGHVDEALQGSGYVARREDELAHLTHPATRECVQAEGIELIAFGDIPRQGA